MKFLAAEDFLFDPDCFYLDVRSPGEYQRAHIPGAANLPLFTDEERAEVGTTYKQTGSKEALLLGLEFVGPKLADFLRKMESLNPQKKIVRMYCFRGGQRSQSMAWLMEKGGFQVELLQGGYKMYRRFVQKSFSQQQEFLVLSGCTGSGKTRMLHALRENGEQVIDLEGLAHHRGSAFGGYHQPPELTTEMFVNNLHVEWSKLQRNRRVWVEDEGRTLGKCFIPDDFWPQMRAAPVVFLDIAQPERVKHLVAEYGSYAHELLLDSVNRIKKRLGPQVHSLCLDALAQKDYALVAKHCLDYYDRAYLYCLEKRQAAPIFELVLDRVEAEAHVERVVEFADSSLACAT